MARKSFLGAAFLLALSGAFSACDQLTQRTSASQPPLANSQAFPLAEVVASQLAPVTLGGRDYVLLASGVRGLVLVDSEGAEVVSLDGGRVQRIALHEMGADQWLIAAYDEHAQEIHLRQLALDPETQRPRLSYLGAQAHQEPLSALCLARLDGRSHLFAIEKGGLGREYIVHPREGSWEFSEVRPLYLGEQVNGCAVDDEGGRLLVAQPPLGIWSLNVNAQRGEEREIFINGEQLGEAFGGLWIEPGRGHLWLAAGDRLMAFSLRNPADGARFARALADIEPVSVAVQRDQLLALDRGGERMHRYLAELPQPQAEIQAFRPRVELPQVQARAQTEAVSSGGDAADDPAIWVNTANPAASLILGTDKKRGLNVYNLSGARVAEFAVGRLNNVDVRPLRHGQFVAFAAASNRSDPGVSLFGISASGEVTHLGQRPMAVEDPYGLCLYRRGEELLVWVSDKRNKLHLAQITLGEEPGQWQLQPRGSLPVAGQVEGCVVDDEKHRFFFGEERAGIWRLDLQAFLAGGAQPELVARVDGERLVADVEGLALYRRGDTGYLLASSQGGDSYALFTRDGSEFVGSFRVGVNLELGIDGASETDGLAVTSEPLGENYPQGLLVLQDGRNRMPAATQNFKLVSWADIAETLKLP